MVEFDLKIVQLVLYLLLNRVCQDRLAYFQFLLHQYNIEIQSQIDATIFSSNIIFQEIMISKVGFITLVALIILQVSTQAQGSGFYSSFGQGIGVKNGLTFRATIFPEQSNSFVGRMSCGNCDPQSGDTSCTVKLPLLCIINYKSMHRPFYNFYPDFTPYSNPDESFYEGWTGGTLAVTDPIRGLEVTTYKFGDNYCKTAYGPEARWARFDDGMYMDKMNGVQLKIEKAWDWAQAKHGEYALWGVFNHNYQGRAWVYSSLAPAANCAVPPEVRFP